MLAFSRRWRWRWWRGWRRSIFFIFGVHRLNWRRIHGSWWWSICIRKMILHLPVFLTQRTPMQATVNHAMITRRILQENHKREIRDHIWNICENDLVLEFSLPWDDTSFGVLGGTSLNRFHTSTKQRRGLRISRLLFEDQCSHRRARLVLQASCLLQHILHGIHMVESKESLPSQLQCYAQTTHRGKRDLSCLQNHSRALVQSNPLLVNQFPLKAKHFSESEYKCLESYKKQRRYRILQLSGSSAQPKMPVVQFSSEGGS